MSATEEKTESSPATEDQGLMTSLSNAFGSFAQAAGEAVNKGASAAADYLEPVVGKAGEALSAASEAAMSAASSLVEKTKTTAGVKPTESPAPEAESKKEEPKTSEV